MRSTRSRSTCAPAVLVALIALLAPDAAGGQILHVDDSAAPGGDGLSWSSPRRHVQDALAVAAESGGVFDTIKVAAGLYMPDRSAAFPDGTGDRDATFTIPDGVSLRGGFAGLGAPDPNHRDVEGHVTILSGAIGGPDALDNSRHVVTISGTVLNSKLNGFVVTAGYDSAPGATHGAAVRVQSSVATIRHCLFYGNEIRDITDDREGGAVSVRDSTATILDCRFVENRISTKSDVWAQGAALGCLNSVVSVERCTFTANSTFTVDGTRAGAIFAGSGTLLELIGCRLDANEARGRQGVGLSQGGTIAVSSSDIGLVNCIVTNGYADRGGAIATFGNSDVSLINTTMSGNGAEFVGGVRVGEDGSVVVRNTILWGNTGKGSDLNDQISVNSGATSTIEFSCIQGADGELGGPGVIDEDPMFVNPVADLRTLPGSPVVDAGFTDFFPGDLTVDIDGKPRIVGDPVAEIDMGAHEFQGLPCPDADGDGIIDVFDVVVVIAAWGDPGGPGDLNGDGTVDIEDLEDLFDGWGACP